MKRRDFLKLTGLGPAAKVIGIERIFFDNRKVKKSQIEQELPAEHKVNEKMIFRSGIYFSREYAGEIYVVEALPPPDILEFRSLDNSLYYTAGLEERKIHGAIYGRNGENNKKSP